MGSFVYPRAFRWRRPLQKALVVADDPAVGDAVADLLLDLDYIPWVAADAASALALSDEIAFDLTLADVALTGHMTGTTLAAELRRRFLDMGIILLVDPCAPYPEGLQDFITFRKPRPKAGACYEPLRFRLQ